MLSIHPNAYRTTALAIVCAAALSSLAATGLVRFVSGPTAKPPVGAVSVIDSRTAWVGLTATHDGGGSWTAWRPSESVAQEFVNGPEYGQTTFFLTATRGWLTGFGSVWMTEDGGRTWSSQVPGHIHAITFINERGWMAAGDGQSVRNYVTENGGQNWVPCGAPWRPSELAPGSGASFLGPQKGWITVAKSDRLERPFAGGVAKTTDGGCTWKVVWRQAPGHWENLTGIQFVDDNFGWLTATYGRLLLTDDGGLHWKAVSMPAEWLNLEGSYLIDRTHGWIIGSAPRGLALYYTSDGGRYWTPVSQADFLARQGLAREIPPLWGAAFLARIQLGPGNRSSTGFTSQSAGR